MTQRSDELELLLQQYADGELQGQPLHAIEQLLAHDASARQTVAHYRHLSRLLASSQAASQPAVDFEQQLAHINFEIDRAETETAETPQQLAQRSRWRIGNAAVLTRTFAAAATLAIVAALSFVFLRPTTTETQQVAVLPDAPITTPTPSATAQISVTGPMIAVAQQVGTVMIQVGPPAGSAAPQGMAEVESIVVPTGRVVAWTVTHTPPSPGYLQ
jgi:anti-sigma factor RsiW